MSLQEEINERSSKIFRESYQMSIGELINLYRDGEMDIHPEFQRVFRWSEYQKTKLIESIMLNIPIPSIFVSQNEEGVWDVIDGVQRLSTIFQFVGVFKDENENLVSPLTLQKTDYLPSFAGVQWENNIKELSFTKEQQLFFKRSRIDIIIMKKESDPNTKYELFQRLNTGGSLLSDQEVRNCLMIMTNKSFYDFVTELERVESYRNCLPITDRKTDEQYRMELLLRLLITENIDWSKISQYQEMSELLDKETVKFSNDANEWSNIKERFLSTFNLLYGLLGESTFKKYSNQKYQGPVLASSFQVIATGVFSNISEMTDRVVVDRQLQKAIMGMEHKSGFIRVMDEKCNSADLAIALNGNTKIIVTTIQKFRYIIDNVSNLKTKRFAVIIDEAHSSTAGKNMAAVTQSLGMGDELYQDMEDEIASELARNGKQANVSMFAFTATPKPTTLQLFGTINAKGQREAFHVYSMKQAIEEGFILDVLQNYTTYKTFYQINKEIEEDPKMQTVSAKRQIARFVELHETNIAQRIEVIVEHFRTSVMSELGGQAKAMVVTPSRQAAVKYCQAFEEYCNKKGYNGIHALVAFSGKVKLSDDDTEYTESTLNGFPEDRLTKEFDKDDYQVLLVADKYQTGFDQPKLCAMYIMKRLKNINAVQTLSRLNRICPPFEKKTFILDFVNSYEDITNAFAPYYTTTILSNSVTPTAIYDLEAQIDAYAIIDPDDVDRINEILYKEKITSADKKKINFCLDKTQKLIENYSIDKQHEIITDLRHFVRFYEFMIQVSSFEDIELHKKYNFIILLLAHINIKHPGNGYNLDGKIRATQFVQKKQDEHKKSEVTAKPVVKLPSAENFGLTPAKEERLSEIIAEINSRTGKAYDSDVAVKAMLQIRDILMKSDKLKASARNNTVKDFEFSYFDDIDDALIEGLEQNQDFFSMLLNDDEIKREVLGIFTEEIYNSLKKSE